MKKNKLPQKLTWVRALEEGPDRRDFFAALALQGMLASVPMCDRTSVNKKKWAKVAFEFADAMLLASRR